MPRDVAFRAGLGFAILAAIELASCHRSPRMVWTNAATTEQLNAIADNISDSDGQDVANPPTDAASFGSSMRAGASKAPQQH